MFSSKLRGFLKDHADAAQLLNNLITESFTNRTFQLYYFYATNQADASHYYPDPYSVAIQIREDQEALDEYLCLVFEILSSSHERHDLELFHKAQSGALTRRQFARTILEEEFMTLRRLNTMMKKVKFGETETAKSPRYQRLIECPDTFEDFLTYIKKKSPAEQDPIEEYEKKYDLLRDRSRPD